MTVSITKTNYPGIRELQNLFLSVEWDSGKHPEKLVRAIEASHSVFTAWDDDLLVGLISVLSDGHMAAYVHYLLVRPEYQHQGIGRRLVEHVVDAYADVPHKVLVAYDSEVGFYERCGFKRPESKSPMFMTSLRV
ncbi:GNAT family N-acetyltransferase [Pseudodesulfovibrio sp.]|nr:GNAT family N-acetyltransferase [Pseudodesulfovibrio sp.]